MQVERLVILGGPSCIGKSFLLSQIRSGNLRDVCSALRIDADTPTMEAGDLPKIEGQYPRMILHYDFVRQMRGGLVRVLANAFASAEEVSYVTLVASAPTLRHRVHQRLRQHLRGTVRGSWPALYYGARFLPALPIYYSPTRLHMLYQRWYDFIAAHPGEHWELDVTDQETLMRPLAVQAEGRHK
jgi:hypothetical protein